MRECKRTDGRRWRCRRPVMEDKEYCETHYLQYCHRLKHEPVPAALKLAGIRRKKLPPKVDDGSSPQLGGEYKAPLRRGRKRKQLLTGADEVYLLRKRGRPSMTEDIVEISDQLEGGSKLTFQDGNLHLYEMKQEYEKTVVKDLMYGQMVIPQPSPMPLQFRTVQKQVPPKMKVGIPSATKVPRRMIRSKNVESDPIATVQMLPDISENIKASTKKNIIKRCHWCKYASYRVFVQCSTCKKQFFCQECINKRFHCKTTIKRECPVCQGTCECRACTKGKRKEVEKKELAIYDCDEEVMIYNGEDEVAISNPEKEVVVYNREKKFNKSQQLHMIRILLPVMENINQEKMNELDIEAKNKGKTHAQLLVQLEECSKKPICSFCSSWVTDVHRSCNFCSYILCIHCCEEFREGYLHSGLGDLRNMRLVRSKSRKISWKFSIDGSIRCPPQTLGGCNQDFLQLTCFSPFGLTKDLEENAKLIVNKYNFKKSLGLLSSPCLLCDGNDELGSEKVGNLITNKGLYFKTKKDLMDKNLKHFMKHWGKGQPIVIRDVLQSQQDLNWDFGYLLCKYLERSAGKGKSKGGFDWCDVQFGRKQIFKGGVTHENVWQELLRFKVVFSSVFFQDHFPDHYAAVMESLPVQEYITGFMNLAMNSSHETGNPNLGPRVCISYGEPNLPDADQITKLCCHAYDMVNILAYASDNPISEENLNEVKKLMNKYSSQEHIKSSKKMKTRKELEKLFESSPSLEERNNEEVHSSSDDSSTEDSDDDVSDYSQHEIGTCSHYEEEQVVETQGAEWDIFRIEDVPKLLEYLKKYSDKLSKSCGSPKKVVHPLFDEVFYLDELHKLRIKEEFNVEPWSFEQHIGEAVIIPAGCPYQMKKVKSCVNVVMDFISPESATNCIKVGDEIRRLPVNHKAKGSMPKVKNMVINGMDAAIEEIRMVSET